MLKNVDTVYNVHIQQSYDHVRKLSAASLQCLYTSHCHWATVSLAGKILLQEAHYCLVTQSNRGKICTFNQKNLTYTTASLATFAFEVTLQLMCYINYLLTYNASTDTASASQSSPQYTRNRKHLPQGKLMSHHKTSNSKHHQTITQTFRVCIFSVRRRNATYGLFVVEPSRFSVRTWGIRACCCTTKNHC